MGSSSIQLIIESLILILGIYMAFVKSYFSEHGKQLALKEHIQDLTRKVESVKSKIDFLTKNKFDLALNERTAILEYHSKYSDWRNSILGIYPSVINEKNYDSKEKYLEPIWTKELLFNNAREKLFLFTTSDELLELNKNVNVGCLELQIHLEQYFEKAAFESMNFYFDKKEKPVAEHLELTRIYYEKLHDLFKKFREEKLKIFESLVMLENKLNNYLRQELFKNSA